MSEKKNKFVKKTASLDKANEGQKEVKKLFLSKSGDTNFHLWKEEMQLKIAIDYPLFADVLEYERHAVFEMPKLEEFLLKLEHKGEESEDVDSEEEEENEAEEDEDDEEEPDRDDEEPERASSAVQTSGASEDTTIQLVSKLKKKRKESEEDFEKRKSEDLEAIKKVHQEKLEVLVAAKRKLEQEREEHKRKLREKEMEALMALYTAALKRTYEDEEDYKRQYISVYAYILKTLSKDSLDLVMLHERWHKVNVTKDPLKLYKLVKKIHLGSNKGVPVEVRLARVERISQMKQMPNESIRQYKHRFELAVTGVKELGLKPEPGQMLTARFIKGLADDKHDGFKMWLSRLTATVGKEAYPKTIDEAVVMITSFDAPRGEDNRPASGVTAAVFTTQIPKKKETRECYNCGKKGHLKKDCWSKQPKHETALLTTDTDRDGSGSTIILDNGATTSIYKDKALVCKVRQCSEVHVKGVSGQVCCREKGTCNLTGMEVLVSTDSPANLISWAKLVDAGFEMTYDQRRDLFEARRGNIRARFERQADGLYAYNTNTVLIATTKANMGKYTTLEVTAAKDALQLMKRMGAPSTSGMKDLLNSGVLGASSVSPKDVDNAVAIYGEPLANLKGKSKEPEAVGTELPVAPKVKGQTVEIYMDLFFWCEEQFSLCVVKPMGLLMSNYLGNAKKPKSGMALKDTILEYKHRIAEQGYTLKKVFMDGEKGLKPLRGALAGMGIEAISFVGSHIGTVEVAIRTVKEQARGVLHTLPYRLPKILNKDLISFVTQRLNLIPSKRGFAGTPAIQAFTGVRVNLDREARVGFGEYVQCVTPNLGMVNKKNDISVARTEGCLALHNANRHGHVNFFCLRTGGRIVRTKWTVLPMSGELIKHVNRLSALENESRLSEEDERYDVIVHAPPERVEWDTFEPVDHGDAQSDVTSTAPPEGSEPHAVTAEVHDATVNDENGETLPRRSSGRSKRLDYAALNGDKLFVVRQMDYCFNMSIKAAKKKLGTQADDAIVVEIKNLIDKGVFKPIHFDFSKKQKLIECFMFLKEKLKPDGQVEKVKARVVANEKKQFVFSEDQSSSPTTTTTALHIIVSLAIARQWVMATADFVAAYLNAEGGDQAMIIRPEIAEHVIRVKPEWSEYLTKKGALVVTLKKALYGCTESAKRWYDLLTKTLLDMGFVANAYDECVFANRDNNVLLCVYVDDLLVTARETAGIEELERKLLERFPNGINFNYGDQQSYLGMSINMNRDTGLVEMSMSDYTTRLCETYGKHSGREVTAPASTNILEVDESEEPLDKKYQEEFHSTVAAALYLGKHARPDILFAVSALSSRVNKCTQKDRQALERLLSYLYGTRDMEMVVACRRDHDGAWKIECFIDAAFAVHSDGKSHSGVLISLGRGGIFFKSSRQKIVCKSAWEAELVAQSDGASQAVWTYRFCNELGAGKFRLIFYCDNLGTIASIKKGKPSNDKSRHVHTRFFWMKQLFQNPDFSIEHKPTNMMIADVLTKPIVGEAFIRLADMLLGHSTGETKDFDTLDCPSQGSVGIRK